MNPNLTPLDKLLPAFGGWYRAFLIGSLTACAFPLTAQDLAAQDQAATTSRTRLAKQLEFQHQAEVIPEQVPSATVVDSSSSFARVILTPAQAPQPEVIPQAVTDSPSVEPATPLQPESATPLEPLPSEPLSPAALTLAELESLAFANNPSISRAAARIDAARGNQLQVGLRPNPIVGYEGQQLGSGGLAEQQGIGVGQEIVRGGKLQLNRAVASQEVLRAEQELAIEQLKVQTDVRIAFYNVLLAHERLALASNLVELSRQGSTAVQTLLRIKEANRADVLQAQLEVENAGIVLQAAENRLQAAWSELCAVVGDRNLSQTDLQGDAFAPPKELVWEQVLDTLRGASPEVAAALAEVCRARFAIERALVEPIPNVTVQGLVNVIDNGIGGRPDGGLAVSIPLPVNNRNQGAIRQTRNELIAAERAVERLELDLKNRLATVYERYSNAKFQVERYRATILPAANESLEVSRKLYQAGESNYLALLTAQRSYFQVNLSYLESVLALRTSESEIDGYLLSGSLSGK
jgi:cobalt-zinc-cadmium efflux system outer membrane protein